MSAPTISHLQQISGDLIHGETLKLLVLAFGAEGAKQEVQNNIQYCQTMKGGKHSSIAPSAPPVLPDADLTQPQHGEDLTQVSHLSLSQALEVKSHLDQLTRRHQGTEGLAVHRFAQNLSKKLHTLVGNDRSKCKVYNNNSCKSLELVKRNIDLVSNGTTRGYDGIKMRIDSSFKKEIVKYCLEGGVRFTFKESDLFVFCE
ncbi:hypothetical protein P9112_006898 [Eukaryota sp. TZLM1-RC]